MHHYGRHGPRAWLKWRRRHVPRPSSLPVPVNRKVVIFHIQIPSEAERALIVLEPSDERQEVTIMSNFPSVQRLPEPEENERVKRAARGQAEVDEKKLRTELGVVIDWAHLESYARDRAMDYLIVGCSDIPLSEDKKEALTQMYWDTYRQYFSTDGRFTIDDEGDRELFYLAKQDSSDPPPARSDGRVAFHKEYGYIIRALEVMGDIPKGTFERLRDDEPHDRADKYGFFCQNHGRMVICPDDTFRRRWD